MPLHLAPRIIPDGHRPFLALKPGSAQQFPSTLRKHFSSFTGSLPGVGFSGFSLEAPLDDTGIGVELGS